MTDAERQDIIRRLNELGPDAVRMLYGTGGLPTNWSVVIIEWLRDTSPPMEQMT
jgi:hypothetical protein